MRHHLTSFAFAVAFAVSHPVFAQTFPSLPKAVSGAGGAGPGIADVKAAGKGAEAAGTGAVADAKSAAASKEASASQSAGAAKEKAKTAAGKLLDLNSASADELKAVPGLAPVADKIIAARPFANKTQLVSKKIVDKATYDQVKGLVVAHKSK